MKTSGKCVVFRLKVVLKHIRACGRQITPNEGKWSKALKVCQFQDTNGSRGRWWSVFLQTGAIFDANQPTLLLYCVIIKWFLLFQTAEVDPNAEVANNPLKNTFVGYKNNPFFHPLVALKWLNLKWSMIVNRAPALSLLVSLKLAPLSWAISTLARTITSIYDFGSTNPFNLSTASPP